MCSGDSVSLQIEIVASYGNLTIQWRHGEDLLDDSEHFALNEDKTVLTIYNALPPHGGFYQAIVSDLRNTEYVIFNVEVHGKTNLFSGPVVRRLKGLVALCTEQINIQQKMQLTS